MVTGNETHTVTVLDLAYDFSAFRMICQKPETRTTKPQMIPSIRALPAHKNLSENEYCINVIINEIGFMVSSKSILYFTNVKYIQINNISIHVYHEG